MKRLTPVFAFAFVKDLRTNREGRAVRRAKSTSAREQATQDEDGSPVARNRRNRGGACEQGGDCMCRGPSLDESMMQRLRRWVLGAAYALRPNRIPLMPRLAMMSLAHAFAPRE